MISVAPGHRRDVSMAGGWLCTLGRQMLWDGAYLGVASTPKAELHQVPH